MTVLRRMAQLVSDLRELGVIRKGDIVFYYIDDGNPILSIEFPDRPVRFIDEEVIRSSMEEEFSKKIIGSDFSKNTILYTFIQKNHNQPAARITFRGYPHSFALEKDNKQIVI